MTWQHAELGIFIAGMAVIALAVIRAWRHGSRELAELQRLGEADDYPVSRGLVQVVAHSPVRIEGDPDPALGQHRIPHCPYCHGIALDSRECTCGEDGCGRAWCPRYDTAVTW